MANLKLSSFVLFVSDVTKSKEFFVNVLDQEIAMEISNINIGFKSGLGLWDKKYATNVIFGKEMTSQEDCRELEIYFETDDLDRIYKRVSDFKIELIHDIKVQPWQQRVFRFYDPDNFIIEVGETMDEVIKRLNKEDMPIDMIAEKTFMPKEVIQEIINKSSYAKSI